MNADHRTWEPQPDGSRMKITNGIRITVRASRAAARIEHLIAWQERGEPEGKFRTQKQAIEAAKEHAREHGDWELVIHGRSGRIRDAVALH